MIFKTIKGSLFDDMKVGGAIVWLSAHEEIQVEYDEGHLV